MSETSKNSGATRERPLARVVRFAAPRMEDGSVDVRRTWQVAVGAILIALGPIAIILGYVGAARTPFIEEQIPYLISGGLLGVALTVMGGFLFWGHWLYRLMERQEYHQQRLYDALREALAQRSIAPAAAFEKTAIQGANGFLVLTGRGSVVHDPRCAIVATRGAKEIVQPEDARERGYKACQICQPVL